MTTEFLTSLYHNNAKGVDKLGVVALMPLPHIPIGNYILSTTHIGLGVDNDAINGMVHKMEWELMLLPPDMARLRDRHNELLDIVKKARQDVHDFTSSTKGKELVKLEKLQVKASATMSEKETAELTRLDNLRAVLANACKAAKKESDPSPLEAAQLALTDFTKSADG